MNTVVQREIVDWYKQWDQIVCDRDQIVNLNRGPFRDFQLNFLMPLVRSNAFIETFRTNVYLQEVDVSPEGDFMEKEVDTALFSAKLSKLRELEEECEQIQASADNKYEILQKKRSETTSSSHLYQAQRQYYNILDERVLKTSDMIVECEQLASSLNEEIRSEEEDNQSHLPALTEAAHLALQSVVMRHYLGDASGSSPRVGGGSLTADEFSALVVAVINEDLCGLRALQWVEKERAQCLKSCEEYVQKLLRQDQQNGLQQSMSDKMKDVISTWSAAHVQAYFKNKSREKLLSEAKQALESSQLACRNDPHIGYRLSDFLGLIRYQYLSAKVERCRQHNNRSGQPLENIFKNISTDQFSSPSPESDIDNVFANLRRLNVREWVLALSDSEQIEEIYLVLLKTWKLAKRNLTEMISFSQQPNSELLANFLQTAEYIGVTLPKPFMQKTGVSDRPRCASELHSALSGSTLSVTSNTSTLEITSVSAANTAVFDSLSDSRIFGSTKNSSSDSVLNDFQELQSLYEQIPDYNQPGDEVMIKTILDKLKKLSPLNSK